LLDGVDQNRLAAGYSNMNTASSAKTQARK
jgi:hypothetical protein